MMKYLRLCRVHQWSKNLFIFAPIFFSFNFNSLSVIQGIWAFIAFSLIASSIYIINDWKDIEIDKLHPKKKNRPLASGAVHKKEASILLCILLIFGFSTSLFLLNSRVTYLLVFYFILNIAYTFKLKQLSIIDISIVSMGFVIRLFIGSLATEVSLSYWIIVLTFLLALLLVSGKRRHDVIIYEETKHQVRASLAGYNLEFLNSAIIIIVSSIFICYLMYTISPEVILRNGEYLYLTSLFVFIGLFRYLQVIFVEKKGDSPTELLIEDRFIQITLILWSVSFIGITLLYKYG